jgi:hypothetical protein
MITSLFVSLGSAGNLALTEAIGTSKQNASDYFSRFCKVPYSLKARIHHSIHDRLKSPDIGGGEIRTDSGSPYFMQIVIYSCKTHLSEPNTTV